MVFIIDRLLITRPDYADIDRIGPGPSPPVPSAQPVPSIVQPRLPIEPSVLQWDPQLLSSTPARSITQGNQEYVEESGCNIIFDLELDTTPPRMISLPRRALPIVRFWCLRSMLRIAARLITYLLASTASCRYRP